MYEGAFPSPDATPTPTTAAEPPIVWLEHGEGVAPGAVVQPAPEHDAQALIEFLLKKVDDHESQIAAQDATIAAHQAQLAEQQAQVAAQQAQLADAAQGAADHASLTELLQTEIDQLRGQLQVTREELDRQLADYEVVMQNALATERDLEAQKREAEAYKRQAEALERELDYQKQRSSEKPKISLPFHTEQKLAKLGWTEPTDPAVEAEAV